MSKGDMFLKIDSIKGESQDTVHKDEIDVLSWSWGMSAQSALSSAGASSKATLQELSIVKAVDSASTALMSSMRGNEPIKKAVLTVRKAGATPLECIKITLHKGRITSLQVNSGGFENTGLVTESLQLSFQRITVEYIPQGADGQTKGAMTFDAEIQA